MPYRWIDAALAQLYQHGIEPYEVMQVLHGRRPRWPRPTISSHGLRFVTVWGRTSARRAVAVTIRHEGERDWLIVGAQELTLAERAEFEKWERGDGESS